MKHILGSLSDSDEFFMTASDNVLKRTCDVEAAFDLESEFVQTNVKSLSLFRNGSSYSEDSKHFANLGAMRVLSTDSYS